MGVQILAENHQVCLWVCDFLWSRWLSCDLFGVLVGLVLTRQVMMVMSILNCFDFVEKLSGCSNSC
uniref:AML1 n=1 Tax=Solanum tuberosum TaxID=4113 RepID=M1BGE1_SOLTU